MHVRAGPGRDSHSQAQSSHNKPSTQLLTPSRHQHQLDSSQQQDKENSLSNLPASSELSKDMSQLRAKETAILSRFEGIITRLRDIRSDAGNVNNPTQV